MSWTPCSTVLSSNSGFSSTILAIQSYISGSMRTLMTAARMFCALSSRKPSSMHIQDGIVAVRGKAAKVRFVKDHTPLVVARLAPAGVRRLIAQTVGRSRDLAFRLGSASGGTTSKSSSPVISRR